jgi:hypothetical protein
MLNPYVLRKKDHPNYIKPIGVARSLVSRDPHFRGTDELSFFPPTYACKRPTEFQRFTGLYLHERYHPLAPVSRSASRNEVYVAVTVSEALRRDLPAVNM